jgi:N-acetylglutamate synthase-like GNAT family acetyltransferase
LLEAEDLDRSAFVLGDFVVAKDASGRFAGCARLKHYDDCVELSSVAVSPDYRGQGVGSTIVTALLQRSMAPMIYLVCEPKEVAFFCRFGFVAIPRQDRPMSIEPKLGAYEAKLGAMVVMKCER